MLNGPKTRPRGWETPFVAGIGRGRRACGPKSPAGVAGTGTRFSNTRAWALTPNHFIQRSSQKPGALSGLPPPREGGAAAPPSREAAGGRVRPTAQTLFGRAGESARMAAAGPERAGWERGTAPPSARPRPRPPLPFWERIASPVLRSPKTDRGPSIFAAGYTPSFSRTADKSRPDPLSPATAWNANKRRRRGCWERRPPQPRAPAQPRGRAGKNDWWGAAEGAHGPEAGASVLSPNKGANGKGAKVGERKSGFGAAGGGRRSAAASPEARVARARLHILVLSRKGGSVGRSLAQNGMGDWGPFSEVLSESCAIARAVIVCLKRRNWLPERAASAWAREYNLGDLTSMGRGAVPFPPQCPTGVCVCVCGSDTGGSKLCDPR